MFEAWDARRVQLSLKRPYLVKTEKAEPSHKPGLFLHSFSGCVFWAETFSLSACVLIPQATPVCAYSKLIFEPVK